MKQFLRLFLCIFISLLLVACNASTSNNAAPEESETIATDSEKGKRSNPYSFGEDVTIEVKASDNLTARFIFNFSQAWDSARIKKEYPKYNVDDACIIQGSLRVELSDPDGEISLPNFIIARLLTSDLNEEYGDIETYKKNELNNRIYTVYDDTMIDFIIKPASNSTELYKYIKLEYKDNNQENKSCWIIIQDTDFNAESNEAATVNGNGVDNNISANSNDEENSYLNLYKGETISPEDGDIKLDITLNEVSFEDTVEGKSTNRYREYYSDQDNETYILMKLLIKNRSGNTISYRAFQNYDTVPQITFADTYNYQLIQMDVNSITLSPYWSIKPLGSQEVYLLRSIPDEVINEPFIITFALGDTTIRFDSKIPVRMYPEDNISTDSIISTEVTSKNEITDNNIDSEKKDDIVLGNDKANSEDIDSEATKGDHIQVTYPEDAQERYKLGISYFNDKQYEMAVDIFEGLKNYKLSKTYWLDAQYLFIQANMNSSDNDVNNTIGNYFANLVKEDYKNSKALYERWSDHWTLIISIGNESTRPLSVIGRDETLVFSCSFKNTVLLDADAGKKIRIEYVYPNGKKYSDDYNITEGKTIKFTGGIWKDSNERCSGTLVINAYDEKGKLRGSSSIYLE